MADALYYADLDQRDLSYDFEQDLLERLIDSDFALSHDEYSVVATRLGHIISIRWALPHEVAAEDGGEIMDTLNLCHPTIRAKMSENGALYAPASTDQVLIKQDSNFVELLDRYEHAEDLLLETSWGDMLEGVNLNGWKIWTFAHQCTPTSTLWNRTVGQNVISLYKNAETISFAPHVTDTLTRLKRYQIAILRSGDYLDGIRPLFGIHLRDALERKDTLCIGENLKAGSYYLEEFCLWRTVAEWWADFQFSCSDRRSRGSFGDYIADRMISYGFNCAQVHRVENLLCIYFSREILKTFIDRMKFEGVETCYRSGERVRFKLGHPGLRLITLPDFIALDRIYENRLGPSGMSLLANDLQEFFESHGLEREAYKSSVYKKVRLILSASDGPPAQT